MGLQRSRIQIGVAGLLCLTSFVAAARSAPAHAQEPPAPSAPQGASGPLRIDWTACEPKADGCFLDADGQWRDVDRLYRLMVGARNPDYLRTFVELTLLVGIGTISYWAQKDKNAVDWDYDGWAQRFEKDVFRYDNNYFSVNWIFHAFAGASYYGLARSNDLGVFGSYVSATLASWAWEFLLEFREKISINDTLVTPSAGLVIGEFFHRLGQYIHGAPAGGGRGHRVLRWTAGLAHTVHARLDGEGPPPPGSRTDEHGFHPDIAARLRVAYAPTFANPDQGQPFVVQDFAFDGSLAALPGYLRPGRFGRFFDQANLTSLRLHFGAGTEGTGVEVAGDTMLLGYHRQSIRDAGGGRRGAAVTAGSSMTYLYRRQGYDEFSDRIAALGLPGLAIDSHFFGGPVSLHLGARLHGEFAGIDTDAWHAWQDENPDTRAKTVLRKQGYYYGWGGSGRLFGEVRFPFVELGGTVRYGLWSSREGLDRSQEEVVADVRARDRALDWHAWVRAIPFEAHGVGLFVEGRITGQKRWSWLESFTVEKGLRRYQVHVGWLH